MAPFQLISPFVDRHLTRYLPKDTIKTIVHLGAHNGSDLRLLIDEYSPTRIMSFECNPKMIPVCQSVVSRLQTEQTKVKIDFVPKAVNRLGGFASYWSVNSDDEEALGSSSTYKLDRISMVQMTVPATTLDVECKAHGIDEIDLICADIEGGEINAFTKQDILFKTKYIISEVGVDRNWKKGYPVLDDLKAVLAPYGFEVIDFRWTGPYTVNEAADVLFVNKNLISSK